MRQLQQASRFALGEKTQADKNSEKPKLEQFFCQKLKEMKTISTQVLGKLCHVGQIIHLKD